MRWSRILTVLIMAITVVAFVLLWLLTVPREPRSVEIGQKISFGFFDPHLHLNVLDTRRAPWPGDALESGSLVLVKIRSRSDAARISVQPDNLRIYVRDRSGQDYEPTVLEIEGSETTASQLPNSLDPGDTIEQTFAFTLPPSAEAPMLRICEVTALSRYLPWFKDGWLHRRLVVPLPD